jgi:hypothetical protein
MTVTIIRLHVKMPAAFQHLTLKTKTPWKGYSTHVVFPRNFFLGANVWRSVDVIDFSLIGAGIPAKYLFLFPSK